MNGEANLHIHLKNDFDKYFHGFIVFQLFCSVLLNWSKNSIDK